MKKPARAVLLLPTVFALCLLLASCGQTPLTLAPPGPTDLGPATGLSTPPPGAVVFELSYLAQTGAEKDIQYHSYWGFGGSSEEAKRNAFIQEVGKKATQLHYVQNPYFKNREWAAVEYAGRRASALYFDLNADAKLSEDERIPPTRKTQSGLEFITPDFVNPQDGGGQTFCRAVLQVNFYQGNSEPNCMWSPGSVLESSAQLNGEAVRLLLFANHPGGVFDKFGSSHNSLFSSRSKAEPGRYIPRETLSSLIASDGQFYRFSLDGRRSNGLPARVLLVKDTSPTGALAVQLAGSKPLQVSMSSLYLNGVDDITVFLRVDSTRTNAFSLPAGKYAVSRGTVTYGTGTEADWEVTFTDGPRGNVKAGEVLDLALGQPTLKVRAVDERNRYDRNEPGSVTFKQNTAIYLEPTITGKGKEIFSRFRQSTANKTEKTDCQPKVSITGPDGKQVLSQSMEYG